MIVITSYSIHYTKLYDPKLQQAAEMLASAQIQIEEAGREIRHYLDGVEMNPERQQEVEERLSSIYDIARKHRINAA